MKQLSDFEQIALKKLTNKMQVYEIEVQHAFAQSLNSIRAEMSKIYEKYAIKGVLTKVEMTKYNRYVSMEKQIFSIVDPAVKKSMGTMKSLLPEQYDAAFFQYAWAMDQGTGVNLSWGLVNTKAILETFQITDPENMLMANALKNYGLNAKIYIRNALLENLSQGKSYVSMIAGMKKALGKLDYEALRIIRTEGQRALSQGQDDVYLKAIENGVEGNIVWDATLDARTRPHHGAMDGVVKSEDGYFHGAIGKALYPLDPNLPAEQSINCIPEYAIPVGEDTEKLYRRYYEGILINIKTANGLDFDVTPNHPVLTDKGWIAANLLYVTGNIVSMSFREKPDKLKLDVNNRPPMASEIFDLFKVMGSGNRQGGAYLQFHGDGQNGYVDIETINSHLWRCFQSTFYKPLVKRIFSLPDILARFLTRYRPLRQFLLSSLHAANSIVGRFGQLLSFFGRSMTHPDKHGFGLVPGVDAIGEKHLPYGISAYSEIVGNGFFGHAVDIIIDDIVSIETIPYSGHVYNLQTKSGWYGLYNSNGNMSIVHNCRCRERFQIEGFAPELRRTRDQGVIPYQKYDDWIKTADIKKATPKKKVLTGAGSVAKTTKVKATEAMVAKDVKI